MTTWFDFDTPPRKLFNLSLGSLSYLCAADLSPNDVLRTCTFFVAEKRRRLWIWVKIQYYFSVQSQICEDLLSDLCVRRESDNRPGSHIPLLYLLTCPRGNLCPTSVLCVLTRVWTQSPGG